MNWNSGSVFSVRAVPNIEFFSLEQLQRQGTELSTAQLIRVQPGSLGWVQPQGGRAAGSRGQRSGVALRTHSSGCSLCCLNTHFITFAGMGFYQLLQRWNLVCERLTLNWLAENLMWCQNVKLSYANPGSEERGYRAALRRPSGAILFFFSFLFYIFNFFSLFCFEKTPWFFFGLQSSWMRNKAILHFSVYCCQNSNTY